MELPTIRLEGFRMDRPPAVVLGDLTLVRPLGLAKIPTVVVTDDPDDITRHSRYVHAHGVVPGFDDATREASADALLALGARLHAGMGRRIPLFYGTDRHLEMLYTRRREFEAHYLFLLHDHETAWALHDKSRFSALCESRGVLAPKTLSREGDLADELAKLREPLLVKPRVKTAWKQIQAELFEGRGKARVFATRRELLETAAFARHRDELIVQEYLTTDSVTDLVSYHGFIDAEGRLLASFCGRKIRTYPDFAGESSFIELVRDTELDAHGRDVARRLGLRGPFKIDLLREPGTSRLYTLEINARFNLWHYLGAVHGVNLPKIAYDYLVDNVSPERPPEYTPTYRWLNFYRDYLAFRDKQGRDELGFGAWFASLASPNIYYEAFAWEDPMPFVHWAKDLVWRRLAP